MLIAYRLLSIHSTQNELEPELMWDFENILVCIKEGIKPPPAGAFLLERFWQHFALTSDYFGLFAYVYSALWKQKHGWWPSASSIVRAAGHSANALLSPLTNVTYFWHAVTEVFDCIAVWRGALVEK